MSDSTSGAIPSPEPWLRRTHSDIPAVPRAVLHALELAHEDLHRWCGALSQDELVTRPSNLPSVAFHLLHISNSLDRLLTYAESRALDPSQLAALRSESNAPHLLSLTRDALFRDLSAALTSSSHRVRLLATENLESPRSVGKQLLLTTLGGLLVHVADHTQRHVGQAITTARLLLSFRRPE